MQQDAAVDGDRQDRVVAAIRDLLPRVLKRDLDGVTPDTALMDDLGMSSTSALELMLELEEALLVEISVEDLERDDFETVGSLAAYVVRNLPSEE